jgi:2-alkyl-3-oxoalkanoate reductase
MTDPAFGSDLTPRPVAALTGGTGFLGRFIALALVKAGYQVRMLARSNPFHPMLEGVALEVVPGDLTHEAALRRLVTGADLVIHAAGLIKAARIEDFFAVNADGAGRLAAASAAYAPEAKLTLVSSLAARMPALSDYAASKRGGEEAALEAFRGENWLIARPCAVYGPWDRETLSLFKMARLRHMLLPGRSDARIAMIEGEDCAAAIVALATSSLRSTIYELSDGLPEGGYRWSDLALTAAEALAVARQQNGKHARAQGNKRTSTQEHQRDETAFRPPSLVFLPSWATRLAGALGDGWRLVSGKPTMLTMGKVREILHPDWSVAPDRLPPADLWRASIDLKAGFARTAVWYDRAGWL